MGSPSSIAIVGAGFSGTLVATQLLRLAQRPITVHLIEGREGQFARGVAYGTPLDCHLLNVPAGKMSAFPDDPDHFLRWAAARRDRLIDPPWVTEVTPGSFLPRRAYGDYLGDVLHAAEVSVGHGVCVERHADEAVGLRISAVGAELRLADGGILRVQRVVLALGNFPPGDPWVAEPDFYQSPRYHPNPWGREVLPALLKAKSCLIIGSGLTMVDWAITLSEAGYRGTLHVMSRRGLWPKVHAPFESVPFEIESDDSPPAVRAWLRRVREYIRGTSCDWRAVIEALRPTNQSLWQRLPYAEQRRFLAHLRPYWDCHRHRIAPVVAARLQALIDAGRLIRHVGRIAAYREHDAAVEVLFRERGHDEVRALPVDAVLNCSGSESDYRRLESPLVRELLDRQLATPDPLLLGLRVAADGALIDGEGVASRQLYTLGPAQKGVLWETTAVPEIRVQAARLAQVLIGK